MSIKVELSLVSFVLPNGHSSALLSSDSRLYIKVQKDTLTDKQTDIVIHR